MIGIDGISMSGLAEILMNLGYKISGSDLKTSHKTAKLQSLGAVVHCGHREENVANPDLVVYTAAIKENNPEVVKARRLNIPLIDRATLLGGIMKKYPYTMAVSGTHGKSTTTSMTAAIMLESGCDPTVHVGAELDAIGGTTRIGGNKYFIVEADEYCGSFLKFHPYLAIILNMEYDHADYYKDIGHVRETFCRFASLVPEEGYLVACADDENIRSMLSRLSCNKVTFGLESPNAMWTARKITFDCKGCASFAALKGGNKFADIELKVPGMHNVNNALAAAAACDAMGCGKEAIRRGLCGFTGARQRFELKGIVDDIKVIDDYAHHPSEIRATLKAARNCGNPRIWCVFQPHTYTRLKCLLDEFAVSFRDADMVVVSDIYAAREIDNGEVHASMLAERIGLSGGKAVYMPSFNDIVEFLKDNVSPGDMVITMGAGNITAVGEMFLESKRAVASI